MKIHIHHRTRYQYAREVVFGAHQLMMRPRENHHLRLEKCRIQVSPSHRIRWIRDLHENNLGLVDFTESAAELIVEAEFIVEIEEQNPFDFTILPEASVYPFSYEHELLKELLPLRHIIYAQDVDRVRAWLEPMWHPGKRVDTLELLQEMTTQIYTNLHYQRREEKGVQSPAETLEKESGSCRDFATLLIEACRHLGLAARFVSGYMYSSEITGRMSMHGWAEVYLPGAGWTGFDPSWGILATSRYIPVAVSRHSEQAPPISGTYIGTPRSFLKTHIDLYVKHLEAVDPVGVPIEEVSMISLPEEPGLLLSP